MPRKLRECRHPHHTLLGVDSTAYFYQCDDCGQVVVAQGGHLWEVQSADVTT